MSLAPWTLKLGSQLIGTILLAEPVAKGRPQTDTRHMFDKQGQQIPGRRPRMFTPTITRKAEERMSEWLKAQAQCPPRPWVEDVVVWLTFFCSSMKPPDGDNLTKLVLDAAKGVLWADDCQVVECHYRVFCKSPKPRTEIVVTALPD